MLTSEDTQLAVHHGAAGIIVSNHGGRQLDGVPAALDALPECVAAAAGRIPVHVDGGIRRGTDVFKALALGAECCWLGRVPLWGLAVCAVMRRRRGMKSALTAASSMMDSRAWTLR